VGSPKRERQRAARLAKTEAELRAERKSRAVRTTVKVGVGVLVVLVVLFLWSTLAGRDGGSDTAAGSEEPTEVTEPVEEEPEWSSPALAEEVLARDAPDPAPPPADLPADALEIDTLIEGEGEGAEVGDTVVVHYVGVNPDGEVFDQSWERETFPVTLGAGEVITGWDEGLVGAKVGERRRLEIGADNAYGDRGAGDKIPPGAPLAFEVDIVDIERAG